MSATDDPAMLAAQCRHKHAKRVPFVYRPDSRLTPTEQWEQKARETLELALQRARARKVLVAHNG